MCSGFQCVGGKIEASGQLLPNGRENVHCRQEQRHRKNGAVAVKPYVKGGQLGMDCPKTEPKSLWCTKAVVPVLQDYHTCNDDSHNDYSSIDDNDDNEDYKHNNDKDDDNDVDAINDNDGDDDNDNDYRDDGDDNDRLSF